MINRIILIGNGFDLAHGLKTSYTDFIKNYWDNWAKTLTESSRQIEDDELYHFHLAATPDYRSASTIKKFIGTYSNNPLSTNCLAEISKINEYTTYRETLHHRYKSIFFNIINKAIENKKWVDIEYEYYQMLKKIVDDKTQKSYSTPAELDKEFEVIKTKLKKYLLNIQKERIKSDIIKDCIRDAIYEPFKARDISNESKNTFEKLLINRLENLIGNDEQIVGNFLRRFGYSYIDRNTDIETYGKLLIMPQESSITHDKLNRCKHIKYVNEGSSIVPDCFLWPDQILFLNFNYTSTADLYIQKYSGFNVNHIHGELDNEDNPIIFGYGDELDENYKKISNLNDNDYLKNIKSMRYLETDNYRNLLSFIDSAPFQIYIMGHSCGNSDRTLLNTLFEHKNCISIKPFYYEKPDGTDNYIEIIQNISRNFNDMRLMRDRVVNKTYCRPLISMDRI